MINPSDPNSAAGSGPRKFNKCVLHIGPGKTGTSAIQNALWKNSKALRKHGILYPEISKNHYFLVSCFHQQPAMIHEHKKLGLTEAQADEKNREYMSYLDSLTGLDEGDMIIFSSEYFWSCSPASIERLKQYLDTIATSTSVVLYARNPFLRIVSGIQQSAKVGLDRLSNLVDAKYVSEYCTKVPVWSSIFGKQSVLVREYPESDATQFDIVRDFLSAIDVDRELLEEGGKAIVNESLSAEAIHLLDASHDFAPVFSPQRQRLIRELKKIEGASFKRSLPVTQEAMEALQQDFDYLEEAWGLRFDASFPSTAQALFGQKALASLAELISEAVEERLALIAERDAAIAERDAAIAERDAAIDEAVTSFGRSSR
ncbi:MAG: hypothetical protein RIG84_05930 [Roseovarius sp.]